MSGGSLDYVYGRLHDAVGTIRRYAADEPDRALFLAFADLVSKTADALHDVEWYFSGDYGRENAVKAIRGLVTPEMQLHRAMIEAKAALEALQNAINATEGGKD